jgi:hypothetical protein
LGLVRFAAAREKHSQHKKCEAGQKRFSHDDALPVTGSTNSPSQVGGGTTMCTAFPRNRENPHAARKSIISHPARAFQSGVHPWEWWRGMAQPRTARRRRVSLGWPLDRAQGTV